MAPDALRAFFRFGFFVAVAAFLLVLVTPRDSAEFIISVCSAVIGLTLMGLVMLVSRFMR